MSDEQMLLARFIRANSALWLEARKDEPQGYNRTPHSLCCYGNPAGFLTLADFLLVARNEPIPVFDALSLGFVTANGFHHFWIEVAPYSDGQPPRSLVEQVDDGFTWQMSGKPACEFAADIHGLGYTLAGNHRHLDNESYPHFTFSRDWSIYCEVVTADHLVLAATSGDMQLVRFCLNLRIGPDEREDIGELAEQPGRSALTAAAEQGHVSIVQLLLDHGATFNKPDGYGRTALEAARANMHSHVVEALEKAAS